MATLIIVKNQGEQGNFTMLSSDVGNAFTSEGYWTVLNGVLQIEKPNGGQYTAYPRANVSYRDDSSGVTGTPITFASDNALRNKLLEVGFLKDVSAGGGTYIVDGTGSTVTGTGTIDDPYQINVSGGGGGFSSLQEMYDADPANTIITDGSNTATVAPDKVKANDDAGNYTESTPFYVQSVDADGNSSALVGGSIGVSGADGQAFAAYKDSYSVTNSDNNTVIVKHENATNNYTIQQPDLSSGDHTPAFSASVGATTVTADTAGNLALDTLVGGGGFSSLQQIYDADPANTIITDGSNTATVAPDLLKVEDTDGNSGSVGATYVSIINPDGSETGMQAGTFSMYNASLGNELSFDGSAFKQITSDGAVLTKITNVTEVWSNEMPDLPSGDHTPVYSASVGATTVTADTAGNLDLSGVVPDTSAFVPYSGAISSVDLANQTLTNVGNVEANGYVEGATGSFPLGVNGIDLNAGTGTPELTVNGTAVISGTNTGDQTTITGNAGTATALQTARTIGTITGDATSAGSSFNGTANNTNALTLATVNSNVGTFGSATQVAQHTVNAKGLVTAASNVAIQIAESQVTGLVTDLATLTAAIAAIRIGFVEFKGAAIGTVVDGTTYWLSQTNNNVPQPASGRTIGAPITASKVNWSLNAVQAAAGATGEGCTVQIRNVTTGGTAVTLSSTFAVNSATTATATQSGTTAFSCAAGDQIECTFSGTWATNPTNLFLNFFLTFQN